MYFLYQVKVVKDQKTRLIDVTSPNKLQVCLYQLNATTLARAQMIHFILCDRNR